jgi:hypothetical protein
MTQNVGDRILLSHHFILRHRFWFCVIEVRPFPPVAESDIKSSSATLSEKRRHRRRVHPPRQGRGLRDRALTRSEEVATALVTIAVIPQIILAGVVAPLNGFVRFLAEGFMSVHWRRRAVVSRSPKAELFHSLGDRACASRGKFRSNNHHSVADQTQNGIEMNRPRPLVPFIAGTYHPSCDAEGAVDREKKPAERRCDCIVNGLV